MLSKTSELAKSSIESITDDGKIISLSGVVSTATDESNGIVETAVSWRLAVVIEIVANNSPVVTSSGKLVVSTSGDEDGGCVIRTCGTSLESISSSSSNIGVENKSEILLLSSAVCEGKDDSTPVVMTVIVAVEKRNS